MLNQARRSGLTLQIGIALVGASLIVGLWVAVWAIVLRDRQQAISDTETDAANLTLAFEEQIVRTVGAIDQTMRFLQADIQRQGTAFDLQRWMAQAPTISDLTLQLAIIGADGRLKASSLEANPDPIDLSDREHFRVHVADDSGRLFIGKPVVGRVSNKWSIQLSRRLNGPDGSFAGVLVFSLDPSYLTRLYRDVNVGEAGFILLAGLDGVVRAYAGGNAVSDVALGASIADSALMQKVESESAPIGTYIGPVSLDGAERIVGYRIVRGYPLMVMIGFSTRDVLAASEAAARRLLGLTAIVTLIYIAIKAYLVIEIGRRARREEELENTAGRLRAIFDTMLDGVVTINESGSIESYNAAAEHIFGHAANEVISRNVKMLMPEPFRSAHDGYLRAHAARGDSRVMGTRRELTAQRKDGSVFPIELTLSEMRLGPRRLFLAFVRDISELKAVERMKKEFVSVVSHELRTPLTSIAGALGLLEGGAAGRLPERAGQLVDIAHKNSERLVRLLNDILDLEKIESGKMAFKLAPVGLGGVVAASIEANRAYAHKLGVELWLAPAAADGLVFADPDRLGQVLTNLLSNAAKFSPKGGRVEVGIAKRGEVMRVSVRDHGPGIPAEFRKSIFQKFAQADSSDARQLGGTGLGLNIAKRIAEHHGGELSFEAAAGGGTLFHLDLPLWRESIPADPRLRGEGTASGRGAGPRGRVLVCEDDRGAAATLARTLEGSGFEVTAAYSAAEAERALKSGAFAALVLEIRLPAESGVELVRRLRESAAYRALAIILVSAHAEAVDAQPGSEALKLADWLRRPLEPAALVEAVRAAIAGPNGLPRVLHVEDDADVLHVVAAALGGVAQVTGVRSVRAARAALARDQFDVMILDLALPDGSGLDLLPHPGVRDGAALPVIIFSAQEADAEAVSRVHAALTKSKASVDELVRRIKALIAERANAELEVPI